MSRRETAEKLIEALRCAEADYGAFRNVPPGRARPGTFEVRGAVNTARDALLDFCCPEPCPDRRAAANDLVDEFGDAFIMSRSYFTDVRAARSQRAREALLDFCEPAPPVFSPAEVSALERAASVSRRLAEYGTFTLVPGEAPGMLVVAKTLDGIRERGVVQSPEPAAQAEWNPAYRRAEQQEAIDLAAKIISQRNEAAKARVIEQETVYLAIKSLAAEQGVVQEPGPAAELPPLSEGIKNLVDAATPWNIPAVGKLTDAIRQLEDSLNAARQALLSEGGRHGARERLLEKENESLKDVIKSQEKENEILKAFGDKQDGQNEAMCRIVESSGKQIESLKSDLDRYRAVEAETRASEPASADICELLDAVQLAALGVRESSQRYEADKSGTAYRARDLAKEDLKSTRQAVVSSHSGPPSGDIPLTCLWKGTAVVIPGGASPRFVDMVLKLLWNHVDSRQRGEFAEVKWLRFSDFRDEVMPKAAADPPAA